MAALKGKARAKRSVAPRKGRSVERTVPIAEPHNLLGVWEGLIGGQMYVCIRIRVNAEYDLMVPFSAPHRLCRREVVAAKERSGEREGADDDAVS